MCLFYEHEFRCHKHKKYNYFLFFQVITYTKNFVSEEGKVALTSGEQNAKKSDFSSSSKFISNDEIKKTTMHLLTTVFGHKKFKTSVQKEAVYAVAKSKLHSYNVRMRLS